MKQLLFSGLSLLLISFFFFFQNSNIFRAKHLPSSYFLRIGRFLGELLVRRKNLFGMKTFTEELLFEAVTSIQDQGSQDSYFSSKVLLPKMRYFFQTAIFFQQRYFLKTPNFSVKQYSAAPTFSEELFFWNGCFFKGATFPKQLLFQRRYF